MNTPMFKATMIALLVSCASGCVFVADTSDDDAKSRRSEVEVVMPPAGRVQHSLFGSDFPIARAVEVKPGTQIVWHSGMVPSPANPDAERYSPEYWGDTKTQALSVFARFDESLKDLGLRFGDVVKMTVFLVPDPNNGGRMDFSGFMEAYTQYYGTDANRMNLPARSAVGVAQLAAPGMLVEIDAVFARPSR